MTRPQKSEYNILSDFHLSIDYIIDDMCTS